MSERTVSARLRDFFPPEVLGWKPQMVKNNRAMAICYIDARDVMDRLDEVVGVENWSDKYTPLPDGSVMCELSVCFDGKWVTKCDVGSQSEQPDGGDREKAAFSDALKRAAVKFGVGRYLYSMPSNWYDYDPVKKQFVQTPQVPAKFLPKPEAKSAPAPQRQPEPTPAKSPPAPSANGTPTPAPPPNARWDYFDGTNHLVDQTTAQIVAAIAESGKPLDAVKLRIHGTSKESAQTADKWGFKPSASA